MNSAPEQTEAGLHDSASTFVTDEVELTLADVEAGLSSLPRAKLARAVALGGMALVIVAVAYRWHEGKDRQTLLVIGIALLLLLVVNRNPARKIAKRVYDSLPSESRRISVGVDDTGLRLHSGGAQSELPWSGIWKLVETRDVLVVFVSRENAQILPKRAFAEAQLTYLRTKTKQQIVGRSEPWLTAELRRRMVIWLLSFVVVWAVWFFFGRK